MTVPFVFTPIEMERSPQVQRRSPQVVQTRQPTQSILSGLRPQEKTEDIVSVRGS